MSDSDEDKKKPTPVAPNKGIEISIVCTYASPWKNAADEFQGLVDDNWNPSTVDLLAVANTPNKRGNLTQVIQVATVQEFMDAVAFKPAAGGTTTPGQGTPRPQKSVRRVNIIGHGNTQQIGLEGSLDRQGSVTLGFVNSASRNTSTGMDRGTVELMAPDPNPGGGFPEQDVEQLRKGGARIRRVLTKDAEIALILCHVGQGEGKRLMKAFHTAFNCKVRAYKSAVFYKPDDDGKKITDRRLTFIERVKKVAGKTVKGPKGPGYPCFVNIPKDPSGSDTEKLDGTHLAFQAFFPDIAKEKNVE